MERRNDIPEAKTRQMLTVVVVVLVGICRSQGVLSCFFALVRAETYVTTGAARVIQGKVRRDEKNAVKCFHLCTARRIFEDDCA